MRSRRAEDAMSFRVKMTVKVRSNDSPQTGAESLWVVMKTNDMEANVPIYKAARAFIPCRTVPLNVSLHHNHVICTNIPNIGKICVS